MSTVQPGTNRFPAPHPLTFILCRTHCTATSIYMCLVIKNQRSALGYACTMQAAAKFNARERSGYKKSTADGLIVEEGSLDPSTELGQMDVLRIRRGRGSGRDHEEASLVSLERKICLAVGWLTFLTVVLVVGIQWRSSEYSPGISDSKSLQREPGNTNKISLAFSLFLTLYLSVYLSEIFYKLSLHGSPRSVFP